MAKNMNIEDMLIQLGGKVIGKGRSEKKSSSRSDVTVTAGKKTHRVCITMRNGYEEKFGDYVSLIMWNDCLYFVTPEGHTVARTKFVRQTRKDGNIHGYMFAHKSMNDELLGLEGDYELQYDKKLGAYYIELNREDTES